MDARALTFEPIGHEYRYGGVRVPSVTQVLRILGGYEGIPAHVLEAKAALGTRVHLAAQLDDEDDLDEASITDEAPYLEGWRRFRRDTGAVIVHNELQVFDPALMVAGTLDRVLLIGGEKVLVDLKTSLVLPAMAAPQTAAYMRLLGDKTIMRRAALRLRPDGTYRFDQLHGSNDLSVFMAALTLFRYMEAQRG